MEAESRLSVETEGRGPGPTFARPVEVAIQILIVLSLMASAVSTLPSIRPGSRALLRAFEVLTISVFTVEYVARLVVARKPARFAFSFFGIIDLLAILPFFLATGLDMRALRSFRLLRLARLFKLFRFSRAIRRFRLAFLDIRAELALFLIACVFVVYIASVGIYQFEHEAQPEAFSSVFSSMWWAVATVSTVGYGDVYPVTVGGRAFTTLILIVGLGIVAVPAGLISSALTEVMREEHETERLGSATAPDQRNVTHH